MPLPALPARSLPKVSSNANGVLAAGHFGWADLWHPVDAELSGMAGTRQDLGEEAQLRGLPVDSVLLLVLQSLGYSLLAWLLDTLSTGGIGATTDGWRLPCCPVARCCPVPRRRAAAAAAASGTGQAAGGGAVLQVAGLRKAYKQQCRCPAPWRRDGRAVAADGGDSGGCVLCCRHERGVVVDATPLVTPQATGPATRASVAARVSPPLRSRPRGAAVDELSFEVRRGSITVLLGHNGSGKSTTLDCITAALRPDGGRILVDGIDVGARPGVARARIGFCPQFDVLWPCLSAREHVRLFATLKGVAPAELAAHVEGLLREVRLRPFADRPACQLSGGMRRRLTLAIAASGQPTLLLLDEPTTGMDPSVRRETWGMIRRLRRRCGVLLTTHLMAEADKLADCVIVLSRGRALAIGNALQLKHESGGGYRLDVTCSSAAACAALRQEVSAACPLVRVSDRATDSQREEGTGGLQGRGARAAAAAGPGGATAEAGARMGRSVRFRVPFAAEAAMPELLARLQVLESSSGAAAARVGATPKRTEGKTTAAAVAAAEEAIAEAEAGGNRAVLEWG